VVTLLKGFLVLERLTATAILTLEDARAAAAVNMIQQRLASLVKAENVKIFRGSPESC